MAHSSRRRFQTATSERLQPPLRSWTFSLFAVDPQGEWNYVAERFGFVPVVVPRESRAGIGFAVFRSEIVPL